MNHKNRILFVDDEISIIHSFKRILDRDKYEIYSTTAPEEALEIINNTELDVILCDQRMPNVSGTEILLHARKVSPHAVRMLMTGYSDIIAVTSAINEGGIFYYFSKPWNQAIKNYLLERNKWLQIKDQLEIQLNENKEKMINSLLLVIKAKDLELSKHSERVSQYASLLADLMGLSEEQKHDLKYAALFHDMGKIAIRDEILYKHGKLEDKEFEEMKHHAVVGAEIIKELGFMNKVAEIILQHHERVDGKGYPKGLTGEQILLEAKILTVADTFDALVSDRIYHNGLDRDKVLEMLRMDSSQRYDSRVIEIFCGGMQNEKGHIVCG